MCVCGTAAIAGHSSSMNSAAGSLVPSRGLQSPPPSAPPAAPRVRADRQDGATDPGGAPPLRAGLLPRGGGAAGGGAPLPPSGRTSSLAFNKNQSLFSFWNPTIASCPHSQFVLNCILVPDLFPPASSRFENPAEYTLNQSGHISSVHCFIPFVFYFAFASSETNLICPSVPHFGAIPSQYPISLPSPPINLTLHLLPVPSAPPSPPWDRLAQVWGLMADLGVPYLPPAPGPWPHPWPGPRLYFFYAVNTRHSRRGVVGWGEALPPRLAHRFACSGFKNNSRNVLVALI